MLRNLNGDLFEIILNLIVVFQLAPSRGELLLGLTICAFQTYN